MLSILPLSHVAAQLTDLVIGLKMGYSIYFTDPSALQGNLVKFLLVCRPYVFIHLGPFLPPFQDYGKNLKKR